MEQFACKNYKVNHVEGLTEDNWAEGRRRTRNQTYKIVATRCHLDGSCRSTGCHRRTGATEHCVDPSVRLHPQYRKRIPLDQTWNPWDDIPRHFDNCVRLRCSLQSLSRSIDAWMPYLTTHTHTHTVLTLFSRWTWVSRLSLDFSSPFPFKFPLKQTWRLLIKSTP